MTVSLKSPSLSCFRLASLVLGLSASGLGLSRPASAAPSVNVDNTNASCSDTVGQPFCTLQAAVNKVPDGTTLNLAAGLYAGTVNIEGRHGLNLVGASRDSVVFKPASTLPWNIASYGAARQTVVRVVDSTDIALLNLTMDFGTVANNFVYGVIFWNSTGTVDGCLLKNLGIPDAQDGYYEYGVYARAPDFTDGARATLTVRNNTFQDMGRVGVQTHDYVQALIQGNLFKKLKRDFGYAIEMGSRSTGSILGNTITDYNQPAAADGAPSAGIYVENAFTAGGPSGLKPVLIQNNILQRNEFGMILGDDVEALLGDVKIQLTLDSNTLTDNLQGGVYVTDAGHANGSSVTLMTRGNRLRRNGTFGYTFLTAGDGEIHASLSNEVLTGHGHGVMISDPHAAPSPSVYDVSIHTSDLSGNLVAGLRNNLPPSVTVDATNNWWGCATGPGSTGCDSVRGAANTTPWNAQPNTAGLQAGTFRGEEASAAPAHAPLRAGSGKAPLNRGARPLHGKPTL